MGIHLGVPVDDCRLLVLNSETMFPVIFNFTRRPQRFLFWNDCFSVSCDKVNKFTNK